MQETVGLGKRSAIQRSHGNDDASLRRCHSLRGRQHPPLSPPDVRETARQAAGTGSNDIRPEKIHGLGNGVHMGFALRLDHDAGPWHSHAMQHIDQLAGYGSCANHARARDKGRQPGIRDWIHRIVSRRRKVQWNAVDQHLAVAHDTPRLGIGRTDH